MGFDPASLDRLLDRPRRALVLDDAIPAPLSPKGLTHKKSTFTRLDALRDLAERATDGATIDEVERVTSRLLDDPEAVDLGVDTNRSEDTTSMMTRASTSVAPRNARLNSHLKLPSDDTSAAQGPISWRLIS